tara:strand:+ start:411 stop:671 length:261 start_codon:yes stop_codon:yes gene_type:complete
MTEAWGLVTAALVTGTFGILGILLRSLRRENRQDHAVVANKLSVLSRALDSIKGSVDKNGELLNDHLEWHKAPPKPPKKKKTPAKK